ncbi:MAG: hypothetical protein EOP45_07720 [Sphingobacteriaceae bacterium]|nr:MAG: hypothetical protein EOP45_07720 [Sphingobacteriaceae bacterium]
MTITALKSADELKQYLLAFLEANADVISNKSLGYFRITTEPAPSIKQENSFVSISLHSSSHEIARNVNDEVANSEKHGDVHISDEELLKYKARWKEAQIEKEFVKHPNSTTYRVDRFLILASK